MIICIDCNEKLEDDTTKTKEGHDYGYVDQGEAQGC